MVVLLVLSIGLTVLLLMNYKNLPWQALFIFASVSVLINLFAQNAQHYHSHTPFFVSSILNRGLDILISAIYGQPQTGYFYHHIAHHCTTIEYNFSIKERIKDIITVPFFSVIDIVKLSYFYMLIQLKFFQASAKSIDSKEFININQYWNYLIESIIHAAQSKPPIYYRILVECCIITAYRFVLLCLNPKFFFFFFLPVEYFTQALVVWWEYNQHFKVSDCADTKRNSVSCYGRLYNLFFFNDGYHQEHHYAMSTHWSKLPQISNKMPPSSERRVVLYSLFLGIFQKNSLV